MRSSEAGRWELRAIIAKQSPERHFQWSQLWWPWLWGWFWWWQWKCWQSWWKNEVIWGWEVGIAGNHCKAISWVPFSMKPIMMTMIIRMILMMMRNIAFKVYDFCFLISIFRICWLKALMIGGLRLNEWRWSEIFQKWSDLIIIKSLFKVRSGHILIRSWN